MTDHPADLARLEDALSHELGRRGAGRRDLMRWLAAAGMAAPVAGGVLLRVEAAFAQTPKMGGKIRVASQSASTADTLDPSRGALTTDYARAFMFYNGLTRLDGKLVPQPELADSISTEGAKVWTFKLRQGVTFHDGSKLTPEDVDLLRSTASRTQRPARPHAHLQTQIAEVVADGPGQP